MYDALITSILNEDFVADGSFEENATTEGEDIVEAAESSYPYEDTETPGNQQSPVDTSTYFLPRKSKSVSALNKINVQKSGLIISEITGALDKNVSLSAIRQALLNYNQSHSDDQYVVDASGNASADAVFTEAIHQFQITRYLDPRDQDGILGRSTLETLGLTNHKLKSPLNSKGFYGQGVLNNYSKTVASATGNNYTAGNWFHFILRPAYLGVRITDGLHELMLQKLHEAETWLLSQTKYSGMTPAALGKALGFNATTRYSGARLSADNQAMHGFGLALDIHVAGNPWIGAGWIKNDKVLLLERTRMIEAFRKASGDNSLPGGTVFAYLHSIAQSAGNDTAAAYDILKQRNDEFVAYIKTHPGELAYWRNSQTFGGRDPLKGFLNLHRDLVYALRQIAGLAWGAMDFGPNASGDIMHFDMRTMGVGKILCEKIGGYVPVAGHPIVQPEIDDSNEIMDEADNYEDEYLYHEAIGEASWDESILSSHNL